MKEIFSKQEPNRLLHVFFERSSFQPNEDGSGRVNLTPEAMFLQAGFIALPEGREVTSHAHLELERSSSRTQEALVVIEGEVEVRYFDIDDSELATCILRPGDCSITFDGGHAFRALTPAHTFEFKNGPYQDSSLDYRKFEVSS